MKLNQLVIVGKEGGVVVTLNPGINIRVIVLFDFTIENTMWKSLDFCFLKTNLKQL